MRNCPSPSLLLALPAALAHAEPGPAGFDPCPFTTSMVGNYVAAGYPSVGQQQNPASGWTFERSGHSGLERTLLEGIESGSWTGGAWGSPMEPYQVPTGGPRYSPIPQDNQVPFHRRPPSFDGLMLHPGFGAQHSRAILGVQGASVLTSLSLQAEHLGQASPNAVISVVLRRANNSTTTLIGPTSIISVAPAVTLTPGAGLLPTAISPGDRVEIETSDGGDASEDWLNVSVSAGLAGPPLIETQPLVHANCNGPTTARVVAAGATGYRWRLDGSPLSDGPGPGGSVIAGSSTATLSITGFAPQNVGQYTCRVSNDCGAVVTSASTITLCFADFNCDGFLDFFDYDEFVSAFETGDPRADYNRDGFADFFDYDDFVGAFEVGC